MNKKDIDSVRIRGRVFTDIQIERSRQVSSEGFSTKRDDSYVAGELALAGALYAAPAPELDGEAKPLNWPFPQRWWKPTDRRRDLVKAAALLIAEIERLDRAEEGAVAKPKR